MGVVTEGTWTERERWVNDMARYVKTHDDWQNLRPEAAVRAALWVVVSDVGAYKHLREAMAADLAEPGAERHTPVTDDGVTYCGWDGIDGCGEIWPCSTVRADNGAASTASGSPDSGRTEP